MDAYTESICKTIKESYSKEISSEESYSVVKNRLRNHFLDNFNQYYRNEVNIEEILNNTTLTSSNKFSKVFPLIGSLTFGNKYTVSFKKELFLPEYYDLFMSINTEFLDKYNLNEANNLYRQEVDNSSVILSCKNWLILNLKSTERYKLNKEIIQYLLYKLIDKKISTQKYPLYIGMVYPNFHLNYDGTFDLQVLLTSTLN